jgi:tetratricopeptide (TPR) repeat protein
MIGAPGSADPTRESEPRTERTSVRTTGGAALGLIAFLLLATPATADDPAACSCTCPEPTAAAAPPASAPAPASDAGTPEPSALPAKPQRGDLEALAWSYLKQGETERAAELADALLAEAPEDLAWQRSWTEIIYEAPGRRDEALAAARRLAAERPADADVRRLLARLLSWSGGQDEAMAIYDALLAENPQDVESLKARADMARWDHDPLTAERLLKRAAAAAPGDAEIGAALEQIAPEAAQLRASRTDPTLLLLFGLLAVPTALGFASRNLTTTTWAMLLLWVVTLLWAVAHLVAPE